MFTYMKFLSYILCSKTPCYKLSFIREKTIIQKEVIRTVTLAIDIDS